MMKFLIHETCTKYFKIKEMWQMFDTKMEKTKNGIVEKFPKISRIYPGTGKEKINGKNKR